MIFNNQILKSNLLGSCYLSGTLAFAGDQLYSPVNNMVKRIDMSNNSTEVLPFENNHQTKLLQISPNGVILVAIDIAGYAVVFNLKGSFVVAEFNFKGVISMATFSQDGRIFAVAQQHGFFVYESPPLYRTFEPFVLLKKYKNKHAGDITALAISPDSRFLVSCGEDYLIYLNNLFPIRDYLPICLEVHRYKIISVSYSHDMVYLYSTDSGGNLFIWKWTEEYLSEGYLNLRASKKRKLDNRRGVSSKNDEEAEEGTEPAWEYMSEVERKINSGRYILEQKCVISNAGGHLKRVVFKRAMGFLATAYSHGKFAIYKLVGKQLSLVSTYSVGSNKISSMAVNDSCTWIALGLKSLGQLIVWEWKSQSYILNQRGFIYETTCIAHGGNRLLSTGSNDGKVKLWDCRSGFCVATFEQHEAVVTGLKFAGENTLFSCSLDGSVNAYDTSKFKRFRKFRADTTCRLNCLQVDKEGETVFAGAFDPYEIYSWSVQTGNLLLTVGGHEAPVTCLKFAGEQLASGSWDKQLKFHEIFARKLNVESLDHGSQITALAVHPNGKQVAAATLKGEIYLWEVSTGSLQGIIQAQLKGGRSYFSKVSADNDRKYLKALAYSFCGNYLYGGGGSKYLMVYDVRHRMVLSKISLTKNKDLQGVADKLNSRYIQDGIQTYQLLLQAQQYWQSDNERPDNLPGSTKLDISEVRVKLEVDIKGIVVINTDEIAVSTSFGVLILSAHSAKRNVFNPYELAPNLTPAILPQLIAKRQYASAILVAIKLGLSIHKLLLKIPIEHVRSTVDDLDSEKQGLLLQKLCQGESLSYRQAIWAQMVLSQGQLSERASVRWALQGMQQQVQFMNKCRALLDMSQLIAGYE